jgi:hypothetical protein
VDHLQKIDVFIPIGSWPSNPIFFELVKPLQGKAGNPRQLFALLPNIVV